MNNPIVSVIIAAYNCSSYIDETIDSVFFQNFNCELIVVNDCSNDNTRDVLKKYNNIENYIYIENEKNLGVAQSRNIGVLKAKGKYIAFLDADDKWERNKLEKQISLMESKKCVLSYTARQLMDNNGNLTGRIMHVPEKISYKKLLTHNIISCSSVILLKDVSLEFPMCHDELHEDYLNWLTILKKYKYAYGINEPLLIYRLNPKGRSSNKIKSAKMTYGIHRYMGNGVFKSAFYTIYHLTNKSISYFISKINAKKH